MTVDANTFIPLVAFTGFGFLLKYWFGRVETAINDFRASDRETRVSLSKIESDFHNFSKEMDEVLQAVDRFNKVANEFEFEKKRIAAAFARLDEHRAKYKNVWTVQRERDHLIVNKLSICFGYMNMLLEKNGLNQRLDSSFTLPKISDTDLEG